MVQKELGGRKPRTYQFWPEQILNSAKEQQLFQVASVYFIQAISGGLVKIGVSSDPRNRLAQFQRNCPIELKIVKLVVDVPRWAERALHEQFKQLRVRDEWFDSAVLEMPIPPDVLEFSSCGGQKTVGGNSCGANVTNCPVSEDREDLNRTHGAAALSNVVPLLRRKGQA